MNHSIYRFTLDIHKTKSQVSIPILLGDTNVQFHISINDGGTPYQITSKCNAKIAGKKSNGDIFYHDCEIDDNRIIYTFTPNTANVKGVTNCEIRIYGPTGVLTTPRFFMVVDEKVILDEELDDYLESFTDLAGLDGIIVNEQERIVAEEGRVEAEAERVAAEDKREKLYNDILSDKNSGAFNGTSVFHEWKNGTILEITSASGTSVSADLKGVGIKKIDKTSSEGLVDTYEITYTDSSTSNYKVTNGKDGITPQFRIDSSTNYWEVSYDNGKSWDSLGVKARGEKGDPGKPGEPGNPGVGISKIELISKYGLEDTYRIYFTNESYFDFTVTNGAGGTGGDCGHNSYVTMQEIVRNTTDCLTWKDHQYCSECGHVVVRPPYWKHDFSDWYEVEASSCVSAGSKRRDCSRCEWFEMDTVAALGHTEVIDAAVEPTCTENGLTEGSHCSVCGETIVAQTVVRAPGSHDYVDFVCTRCGDIFYTSDEYFTFELLKDGTYSIKAKDNTNMPKEVSIPSKHDGKDVTVINAEAFYYCPDIIKIAIPDTITSIGDMAFRYCNSLEKVVIGKGVTSIGYGAFYSCENLSDIAVSEDNQYYKSSDGDVYSKDGETFVQYAMGKSNDYFEIPSGVTTIGAYAFRDSYNLIEVKLPDSVRTIGAFAFENCSELTKVDIQENSVTTIDSRAFFDCIKLVDINIPDSVSYIGDWAFYKCSSYYAEEGIEKEIKIKIPAKVTSINAGVFMDYKELDGITIHDGVTSIGTYALAHCDDLITVFIPNSVAEIGRAAFHSCDNLTIELEEGNPNFHIKNGCLMDKKGNVIFANATASIPSGASAIGEGAFGGYYAAPIKIPLSVQLIESLAFQECEGLIVQVPYKNEDEIPSGWASDWHDDSVTVVWGYKEGSASCTHVYGDWTTIVTPTCTSQGVKEKVCTICGKYEIDSIPTLGHIKSGWIIDKEATIYTEGKKHKECTICGHILNVETIPKFDFVESENLRFEWINNWEYIVSAKDTDISGDIYIPSTYDGKPVTTVSWDGFSGCHNITSVTIAEGVSLISYNAFAGCTNLKKVIIPDTVKFIGEYAFAYCDNLECLVIGSGVEEIGDSAIPNYLNRDFIYYRSTPDDWMKIKSGDNNGLYVNTVYYYFNNTHPVGSLKYWHYVNGEIVIWNPIDESFPEYLEATRYYDYYEVKAKEGATLPQILEIPATYNNVPIIRIADRGFSENLYLNEVRLPEGIREIGSGAFFGCDMIGYDLVIPSSVELIESNAFGQCGGIRTITFASGSNDYTRIKNGAFSDCQGLQVLNISSCVYRIEEGAFERCYGLESITVDEGNRRYYSYNNCIIERGTNTMVLGCKGSVIPSSVTSIGSGAFYVTMHEAPIKIPISVTVIKPLAFSECEDLIVHCEASSKPDGWADDWCGDNVTVVWGGNDPYEGFMLESIYDDDTEVRSYSVRAANEFISGDIIIPSHFYRAPVVQIAPWGFAGCKDITSVIIPYGIEHIGEYAFADCANLTKAVIFDTTDIDQYAFFGCDNLECLVIGSGVCRIASYALPEGLKTDYIYYEGTKDEWERIDISSVGNTVDTDAIYYYSDSEPTEEGNYWHWVDDEIVVWGTPDTYLVTESGEHLTDEQGNLLII